MELGQPQNQDECCTEIVYVFLLRASSCTRTCRQASLKVLARLDIGTQELHMVSEEEVELLLYTLQQLG